MRVEDPPMHSKYQITTIEGWRRERATRVDRAVDVFDLAFRLFGAAEFAREWLSAPNVELGRRRPCDLVFAASGVSSVSALLRRQLASNRKAVAMAGNIFGDRDSADKWLKTPNAFLGGRRPTDLLRGPEGAEVVECLLDEIGTEKRARQPSALR